MIPKISFSELSKPNSSASDLCRKDLTSLLIYTTKKTPKAMHIKFKIECSNKVYQYLLFWCQDETLETDDYVIIFMSNSHNGTFELIILFRCKQNIKNVDSTVITKLTVN